MMPDEIWHQSLPSGMPGHPVRSVFNNKIEFIHNYKAASSAVAAFLSCAYGREVDSSVFEASVFVVRDPIDRFISAVGDGRKSLPSGPDFPAKNDISKFSMEIYDSFINKT